MRMHRSLFIGLVGLVVLAGSLDVTARGPSGPAIAGGGIYNVLDDTFGGSWSRAGQIAISGGLNPNGSAYGQIDIVGRGDFAAAWGACPYDPRCEDFPNTSTFTFHLIGGVSAVSVAGDTVQVSGSLVETDYGKGDGVIFIAENEPFVVTATAGSSEFVFQFCQVPPFTMTLDSGSLQVTTGSPVALLKRPVPSRPMAHALPCQTPSPQ